MESRANVIAAGLFVIGLTLGLIGTALWLTRDSIDRVPYLVVSRIPISGLHAKATVRLRGVDVGRVDSIAFDPSDVHIVLVRIAVDRAAPLSQGTYAQLAYQGVTGLSYIALDDDGSSRQPLTSTDADPARIDMRRSLLDNLGESSGELIQQAKTAAQRVNLLLSDANLAHFSGTLRDTEQAAHELAALAVKLQPAAQALQGLAGDTRVTEQKLDVLLGDLHGVTVEFGRRIGVLDQVGHSAQQVGDATQQLQAVLIDDTLPMLSRTAGELARTSHTLDGFLTQMQARPQSLIFGPASAVPGPGEPGFAVPAGAQ